MAQQQFDLNNVTVDELTKRVPQLGKERAQKLIDYRGQNGPFRSWDDLKKIPGFSQGLADNLKQSGATIGGRKAA